MASTLVVMASGLSPRTAARAAARRSDGGAVATTSGASPPRAWRNSEALVVLAPSNKCLASSNKCLTSSNKKLLELLEYK